VHAIGKAADEWKKIGIRNKGLSEEL